VAIVKANHASCPRDVRFFRSGAVVARAQFPRACARISAASSWAFALSPSLHRSRRSRVASPRLTTRRLTPIRAFGRTGSTAPAYPNPNQLAHSSAVPTRRGRSQRGLFALYPYLNRWLAQSGRFRNPLIIHGSRPVHVFGSDRHPFGLLIPRPR